MTENGDFKYIYIVVSQTGTVLSRILKFITRSEYNHASISFQDDLSVMYSFGRRNPYNPFWGGFVTESASYGTFKRFSNTKAVVLALKVSAEKYEAMCEFISFMLLEKENYSYNYLGVCLAAFKIAMPRKNSYYCSEFVRDVLLKFDINGTDVLGGVVHPMQFLRMPTAENIYQGKLKDFTLPVPFGL